MVRKNRKQQKPRGQTIRDAEDNSHAPQGRGGSAMGRTVGLPYGGARPRKRATKSAGKKKG